MTSNPKFPADVPRGHAKLERAAANIRRTLGFSPTHPVHWLDVLSGIRRLTRRVGGVVYPLDYHVGAVAPGVEAKTHFFDQPVGGRRRPVIEILLSIQTYEWLEAGVPRALYSLLHELGHAVLHTPEVIRLSSIPHATAALLRGHYADIPAYRDVEWQANTFAACYLMPAVVLAQLEEEGRLTVDALANHYGASRESAGYRISTFRQRRGELMEVYS
jgi:hypothetical protein